MVAVGVSTVLLVLAVLLEPPVEDVFLPFLHYTAECICPLPCFKGEGSQHVLKEQVLNLTLQEE